MHFSLAAVRRLSTTIPLNVFIFQTFGAHHNSAFAFRFLTLVAPVIFKNIQSTRTGICGPHFITKQKPQLP